MRHTFIQFLLSLHQLQWFINTMNPNIPFSSHIFLALIYNTKNEKLKLKEEGLYVCKWIHTRKSGRVCC